MYRKTIIPYHDGRHTVNGLRFERGLLIDRIPAPVGMIYRFDLSEIFADCLTYASVEQGGGVLGEIEDRAVSLFFDGSIHHADVSAADYGRLPSCSGASRVVIHFYSESGEHYAATMHIEQAEPGGMRVVGPSVDEDGILIKADGEPVTNANGWWLRFAQSVRHIQCLEEIIYPVLAQDGEVISTADGEMLVYRPDEYVYGGDSLKPTICADKGELNDYYMSHGEGPMMIDETGHLVWASEPEVV